jgi:L-fuconolactonase
MMRLDAHQHFWLYSSAEYGWINEKMSGLKRDFLPQDLAPLLAACGSEGSIAVQARQSLEETRWLLELAEQNDLVKGVVGWVDLCSPVLAEQLDQFTRHPKFQGVRHLVQDEPDNLFMLRPDFRLGIAKLAEFDLAYDLLLYPRHLPVAVKLVREFPHQRFVLDHIAKPDIAGGVLEPWGRDLRELAEAENVWCKLSGMVTEARWNEWGDGDFSPYLDVVFEAFGVGRLMIGSDWPVCTLTSTYSETVGIVMKYIKKLTPQEREAVLGVNCSRFYGVDTH